MNSSSTKWCQIGPLEKENSRLAGRLHHLCNFWWLTKKENMQQEYKLQCVFSSCCDCCTDCKHVKYKYWLSDPWDTLQIEAVCWQFAQISFYCFCCFICTSSLRLASQFSQRTWTHWYLSICSLCQQLFYIRKKRFLIVLQDKQERSSTEPESDVCTACLVTNSPFSFQASLLVSRPSRPTWSTAVKAGYVATRRRWRPSIIHRCQSSWQHCFLITGDSSISALSWLKPPKPSRRTKWGMSSLKLQSSWWGH